MNQQKPLIVIVGETATGKSDIAMFLAKKFNGEIVNADSWSTRKYMDIGTSKPSKEDRKRVKHHLIDIAEPGEDFTAATFKKLAEKAIEGIKKKDKLPILVGGSGLYIDSVLYNYSFLEAGDREKRQALNSKTISELLDIINKLKIKIPAGLDKDNKRRLIRLIEVEGKMPTKSEIRSDVIIIGIKHRKDRRTHLIEERVDRMLKQGLESEVSKLANKYGWDCDALMGIGYRQWERYFNGNQSFEETKQQIVSATTNLSKKQATWFKRNKSIHWFTTPVNKANVVAFLTTKYSSHSSN